MIRKILVLIPWLLVSFTLSAQVDTTAAKNNTEGQMPDIYRVTGKPISGTAATYSSKADGSKTLSGEIFYNNRLTAACNKFSLGTWVKVTCLKNNRSVLVRINDRTSKKKSAPVIQLSRSAVASLGFLRTGSANIKIEKIDTTDYKTIESEDTTSFIPKKDTLVSTVQPDSPAYIIKGKSVTGIASYYSSNLDGTKTSTGERYRNNKFTAASNNFKLNTWVKVTNLSNGKSVIVRINDRMHPRMKKKGRVVDLSRVAAGQLDFMAKGLTRVEVETIVLVKQDTAAGLVKDSLPEPVDSLAVSADSSLTKNDKPDSVKSDDGVHIGIASFYSANLDGTKTATGEVYRNNKMSAASNHFPLNTWVRVTSLRNKKSVIVRINDRMHPRMKAKGRVVDLSRLAAKKLDFMKNGLTRVKVEPVKKGTLH